MAPSRFSPEWKQLEDAANNTDIYSEKHAAET